MKQLENDLFFCPIKWNKMGKYYYFCAVTLLKPSILDLANVCPFSNTDNSGILGGGVCFVLESTCSPFGNWSCPDSISFVDINHGNFSGMISLSDYSCDFEVISQNEHFWKSCCSQAKPRVVEEDLQRYLLTLLFFLWLSPALFH